MTLRPTIRTVPKSTEIERWFKRTKPPSEGAMRRVRDVILDADASMSERVQYGVSSHRARAAISRRSSGTASPVRICGSCAAAGFMGATHTSRGKP